MLKEVTSAPSSQACPYLLPGIRVLLGRASPSSLPAAFPSSGPAEGGLPCAWDGDLVLVPGSRLIAKEGLNTKANSAALCYLGVREAEGEGEAAVPVPRCSPAAACEQEGAEQPRAEGSPRSYPRKNSVTEYVVDKDQGFLLSCSREVTGKQLFSEEHHGEPRTTLT